MNLINKYFNAGKCDLNGFTQELAGMNHKDQICVAQDITKPLDYASSQNHMELHHTRGSSWPVSQCLT